MENGFEQSFEEELRIGLAYLKIDLSKLIQYTVFMGISLQVDQQASEFFQKLEQLLYQIRERVDDLGLNLNANLKKSTPFITKILTKEIKELAKLHYKASIDPKNEYTTTISDLQNDLQSIVEELKRFNQN